MVLVNADGSDDLGWVADLISFFCFLVLFQGKKAHQGSCDWVP